MKKYVILKNGGGELANQLWNYVSIYACALHSGAHVSNPSFFEYHRYFTLWKQEGFLTRFLSFWFKGRLRRRSHFINQFWRRTYRLYVAWMEFLNSSSIYSSENKESEVTYLSPTVQNNLPLSESIYFEGWLFRNPEGLRLYREQIQAAFSPTPKILQRVTELTNTLKKGDVKLIGIHLRQGDYKIFKKGVYLITPERMRETVDEYLSEKDIKSEQAVLFIASDGPIPAKAFNGYRVHISSESAVTDLFMLSRADAIIGSNSSFGHFASWYGNIPHIVATDVPIDWDYYRDKEEYFQNKYCTLARL